MKEALSKTSNVSVLGPDGISYWFIKAITKTKLNKEQLDKVMENI